MENSKQPMIDGKQALMDFAREHHWRHEHSVLQLEKLLRRAGFEAASTEDTVHIKGPLGNWATCRTMVPFGGSHLRVRHLEVIRAIVRLMDVGVPTGESEAYEWYCRELGRCDSYQVPALEEFQTRQDLETHVETCGRCQPVFRILQSAVDGGSSRNRDQDLRELITRSHEDAEAAKRFYQGVYANTFGAMISSATAEKPSRAAKREQVPA